MELTKPADTAQWLRDFREAPDATVRLVCFPHAGGSASYFWPLSTALSATVDVRAIQYPGRQDRRGEALVDTIAELADRITEVLEDDGGLPTAFFGHSMGATVAYEVARRRENRGRTLKCLFASGRRAPGLLPRAPVPMSTDADALAEMKRLSGTDTRLLDDDEMLQVFLPVVRNDFHAAETYRHQPGPELHCPIVALRGHADPHVFTPDADHWRNHTTASFTTYTFDGGHFYLDNRHEAVAKIVEEELARPAL